MVDTALSLEGNCKSISEEMGMPRQVSPLLLALHGALVLSLLGAKGSICSHQAFWPAAVCLKCWRSALLAKGGDAVSVVLAQESMELFSCAGMWLGQAGSVGTHSRVQRSFSMAVLISQVYR